LSCNELPPFRACAAPHALMLSALLFTCASNRVSLKHAPRQEVDHVSMFVAVGALPVKIS
jgi:hypothetical protein